MRNINIILMAHRRPEFSDFMIKNLAKSKFKDNVHLSIYICSMNESWAINLTNLANSLGVSCSYKTFIVTLDNYMRKLYFAEEQPYEYSVKIDEDIFLSPKGWDFFIENIPSVLASEDNILFTMTITNGIPTCDYFIKDNMSEAEQAVMNTMFSSTHIPDQWGARYGHLNEAINGAYESNKFFDAVSKGEHFYKGMHPIRVNAVAQKQINNWLLANPDKFFNQEFYLHEMTEPYLCNSLFAIKNTTWKKIIYDQSLFKDVFDEVATNNYRYRTNGKFIVARKGFAVHTLYNTLFSIQPEELTNLMKYEFDFVEQFRGVCDGY